MANWPALSVQYIWSIWGNFPLYTGPVFPEYFTHTDPHSGPSSIPPLAPADLSQLCSWFLHHVPFKIIPIAPNMVIYTYCMYVVGATDVRTYFQNLSNFVLCYPVSQKVLCCPKDCSDFDFFDWMEHNTPDMDANVSPNHICNRCCSIF